MERRCTRNCEDDREQATIPPRENPARVDISPAVVQAMMG